VTITFENENDVILYASHRIISYAKKNHYIFVTQCIWWISSIIGLQQGMVTHINNLKTWERLNQEVHPIKTDRAPEDIVHPSRVSQIQDLNSISRKSESTQSESPEIDQWDRILEDCEKFLLESDVKWRKHVKGIRKKHSIERRIQVPKVNTQQKPVKTYWTQMEAMEESELHRIKAAA